MVNMKIVLSTCQAECLKGNHKTISTLASNPVEVVHSHMNLVGAQHLGKNVKGVARETISHMFVTAFVIQPRR